MEDAIECLVPTFFGHLHEDEVEAGTMPEYGSPEVPVLIAISNGLRIILGTHDVGDENAPDVLIERQPNGWGLFVHPQGVADPSCYLYIRDDGETFLVPESPGCSPGPVTILPPCTPVPGFHDLHHGVGEVQGHDT